MDALTIRRLRRLSRLAEQNEGSEQERWELNLLEGALHKTGWSVKPIFEATVFEAVEHAEQMRAEVR